MNREWAAVQGYLKSVQMGIFSNRFIIVHTTSLPTCEQNKGKDQGYHAIPDQSTNMGRESEPTTAEGMICIT